MVSELLNQLGFIGDFHPVAVHFPVALLPTVLLLKVYQWRSDKLWPAQAVTALLGLALVFAVVAVVLGVTTRSVNGFSGEAVDQHALLGVTTLLLLGLCFLLHWRYDRVRLVAGALFRIGARLQQVVWRVARLFWTVLKWLLLVVLLPLVLVFWILRGIYRRFFRQRLQPRIEQMGRRVRKSVDKTGQQGRALWFAINRAGVWQNSVFVLSLSVVFLTGLKGADISHGAGHLTRNLPPALAALFEGDEQEQANRQLDRGYYEQELLPVFRRSCIKCHGEDKQKAGLRLDNYAALIDSGAVHWQDPYGSELVRRILLPRDDAGAMPPSGKSRELHTEDISTIVAWLQGHSLESLAQQGGGMPEELKRLANNLNPVTEESLEQLNRVEGLRVMRLVENYDLLVVSLSFVPASQRQPVVDLLQDYALHIVDLELTGRRIENREWQFVSGLKNLQRLNLSGSPLSDSDLARLASLQRLQWLNVFGTELSLGRDELVALLPGLETVYLPAKPLTGES